MSNFQTWAVDVAVRAVKTAAQTAVAALGVNASGLLAVNWVAVGSLSGLAAITCILQNLTTLNLTAPVVAPVLAAPTNIPSPMTFPTASTAPTSGATVLSPPPSV